MVMSGTSGKSVATLHTIYFLRRALAIERILAKLKIFLSRSPKSAGLMMPMSTKVLVSDSKMWRLSRKVEISKSSVNGAMGGGGSAT